ncbi:MAG: ATP-binding protein [Treponema sp.]|jgi:predicted AAA+ superfamily ATPase|nr:ATP-binding protein [Treponema sp.]
MIIKRSLKSGIEAKLLSGKAIVIFGARQVGKTTLLHDLLDGRNDCLWLTGDDAATTALFEDVTASKFNSIVAHNRILVIDEAQRIQNIGLKLKIIHDALKSRFQIIATGSSSFDLANEINEPLTGRKWTYKMFPLSFTEMVNHTNLIEEQKNLENRLLYGYYPDVVNNPGEEKILLRELANDNLYKDIFKWENVKKPLVFEKLVKALAMQIGSQVSINELSNLCNADNKTIERYIRLLEQSFVLFRLGSFSTNLRNEIKSSEKYYFYDVGIRNAVIGAFEPVAIRQDIGHLFENFIIAELAKKLMPSSVGSFGYFWRTTQQQEIDFVTTSGKNITAYEIKWNPNVKVHLPKTFLEKYNPVVKVINRENFSEVLTQ